MVARFLPTFSGVDVTEADKNKCAAPMKWDVKLTKEMSSENEEEVRELERECSFHFVEAVGCFNWSSYTCYEETFATRKLCKPTPSAPTLITMQRCLGSLSQTRALCTCTWARRR